jgi:DNA-binding winged helix-turn-helix (wHTH) protein
LAARFRRRSGGAKNGVRLKLQGKVYQVLLALIEKQGEVVTREEIRVRLWPADSTSIATPTSTPS